MVHAISSDAVLLRSSKSALSEPLSRSALTVAPIRTAIAPSHLVRSFLPTNSRPSMAIATETPPVSASLIETAPVVRATAPPLSGSALGICPAATAGSTAQLPWPNGRPVSGQVGCLSPAGRGAGSAGIMPAIKLAVCIEYRREPAKPRKVAVVAISKRRPC
jgi:hypothetical protein